MTATRPRTDRPLTAWRNDPRLNRQQLTHAVSPGRTIAFCGVQVSVTGPAWPDPGVTAPLSRCSICTQALHQLLDL